jgi:hypothetical protein
MSISDLNALVAILLAIALAAERFVTFLKNVIPWLADHPPGSKNAPIDGHEWLRRTAVQTIGFLASWLVSGYLSSTDTWSPFGSMAFGDNGKHMLPVWVVGLLASSGSALWSSVLGLTSAAKDLRKQNVVSTGMTINERQTGTFAAAPTFKH